MPTSARISRRTLLRGMSAAAIALPLLEVMAPETGAAADPAAGAGREPRFHPPRTPVRMLLINQPCGTYRKEWQPDGPGPLGELKPMLRPLQALTGDFMVLGNLWNKAATADGISHYANETNLFTGTVPKKTAGANIDVGGISADQLAARCTGAVTRFPSLHLGMQAPVGGVDSGWARMYNNQLSWSTPTTPVPNEIDAKRAFDRLFRAASSPTAKAGGAMVTAPLSDEDRKSVLDDVLNDATALRLKVSVNDQRKLDDYLTSVRDVERQLDREIRELAKERRIDPAATHAVGQLADMVVAFDGKDHTTRTRLMLDILTLAFWTDSTRVATFMFGNERNDINYSFIDGVKATHHEASHHTESAQNLANYKKITVWHAEQVAYLLTRMKAIKEANGRTLLDDSLVFWGSALADGNTHARENLPIILAGRGGGGLKPGRTVMLKEKTPLCNLYLTMMQCLGIELECFADSTGVLQELANA